MEYEYVYLLGDDDGGPPLVPLPSKRYDSYGNDDVATNEENWEGESGSLHASDFTFATDSNENNGPSKTRLEEGLGAQFEQEEMMPLPRGSDETSSGICSQDLVDAASQIFDFGQDEEVMSNLPQAVG